MEPMVSGVGVLDKSMAILGHLETSTASCSLTDVVQATGLPKPTAHRLLVALEVHGLTRRDATGAWSLGGHLIALGRRAMAGWSLVSAAGPALARLRGETGESAQLYVVEGDHRRCVASLESPQELRTIVPEGAMLPLDRGSAGKVLRGLTGRAGWVASVGERQEGVASVSAPVIVDGAVLAAVGVSGPIGRLGPEPGSRFGAAVRDAAAEIGATVPASATMARPR